MNPLAIKGIAALVVAIALAGIGWKVNQWRHDAGQLKQARAEIAAIKRQQAADAALASDYAKQLDASRAATERLRQRVAAIPKETLVYVETPGTCPKLSADFVREYNAINTD
jgi:hypothetical protein